MIRLTDTIWIGTPKDEMYGDLAADGITGILNVSLDLDPSRGWAHGIEYMHVGLMDGPGNTVAAYSSAILALSVLLEKHERVIVVGHGYSRSLAVVIMHTILTTGRVGDRPSMPHYWKPWDKVIVDLEDEAGMIFDHPHEAHREVASMMPFGILEQLI